MVRTAIPYFYSYWKQLNYFRLCIYVTFLPTTTPRPDLLEYMAHRCPRPLVACGLTTALSKYEADAHALEYLLDRHD